jgi:hypothetical protein
VDDAVAVSRTPLAGFSVALQPPPGLGHRRDRADARRRRALGDLDCAGLASRKAKQFRFRLQSSD